MHLWREDSLHNENKNDYHSSPATSTADKLITVRGSVENVTNEDYWASVGGEPGANYLALAAPRTFKVSLSVDL
ncbi:MAG: iron complex outerrane recepter protein [Gammaproteobacteria bacterium]|nr:iron complex outerrane recepter protein [Gammaproteobacteria bacterium]